MTAKLSCTIIVISAAIALTAFKAANNGKIECDLRAHELKGKVNWCEVNTKRFTRNRTIRTDAEQFYNSDGNIVKELYSFIPVGEHERYTDTVIITYDAEGRRVLVDDINNHLKIMHAYHYNDRYQLLEGYAVGNESPSFITYNAKGYRDTFIDNTINGKFNFKVIYRYDAADNNIEEVRYLANDVLDEKVCRQFDDKNRLITETRYGKTQFSKKNFGYDSNDNKTMEVDSGLHELRSVTSGKNKGATPPDVDSYVFQYKNADSHGNWLQKTTLLNGKKTEEIKRKIKYDE